MIQIDALGQACPLPAIRTKNAIRELETPEPIEVLVDNDIATQNLTKLGTQLGYDAQITKEADQVYKVILTPLADGPVTQLEPASTMKDSYVVAISSATMGVGNDELGKVLMKGFIYALTEQEDLPKAILLYNGGILYSTEGSASLEDLQALQEKGVEILSCGTCLNYYDLSDKLAIGDVTNLYSMAEIFSKHRVVKP